MDRTNLVCPECSHQVAKGELLRFNFESFYENFQCPDCYIDIHPEDAYLQYFRDLPDDIDEVLGRPLMLGGFATAGARRVEIGKISEEGLLGVGETVKIDIARVFRPPTEEETILEDLDGDEIEIFWNRLLFLDESVITYIEPVELDDGSTKLGIITSQRSPTDETEVNVGYHVTYHLPEIESPPWIKLLREAARNYYQGDGLSARALLVAAYDNHLSNEIVRTLRAKEWEEARIEEFLGDHYRWKQRSKDGLRNAAGESLFDYDSDVYTEFAQMRHQRNNYLIHIAHDASVMEMSNNVAREDFKKTLMAILAVSEICYAERQAI